MQDIRKTIEVLRDDTSECELLGILAVDERTRLESQKRAANNKRLIAEAEQAVRQSGIHNEENRKS